jgi:ectoine hydroxylase-related dioxygenase (phytanoyl-CoA dioxygenase family)
VVSVPSSNGVPVEFTSRYFAPMRDSTGLLAQPGLLRERYREDGYVLLRQVLDPAEVMRVRAGYFSAFPAEYFKAGTRPGDGVFSGTLPASLPAYGVRGHPAHDFVRSPAYEAFAAQPALAAVAAALLDGDVQLIKRKVLRHYDRASRQASRAHVDRAYQVVPEGDVVTLWLPLGDCPLDCGGLVYLSGSYRQTVHAADSASPVTDRPDDPRPFSHDLAWTARELGGRWLWTDFRAGDVAAHCPDLVHASLDTVSDVMRLSTDIRFQRVQAPVDPRWTVDWAADDGA